MPISGAETLEISVLLAIATLLFVIVYSMPQIIGASMLLVMIPIQPIDTRYATANVLLTYVIFVAMLMWQQWQADYGPKPVPQQEVQTSEDGLVDADPIEQPIDDLPDQAEVSIQVFDMLGRNVLSVPAQTMSAGPAQSIQVDGSNLASGMYLYRLRASMEGSVQILTGRMTLLK